MKNARKEYIIDTLSAFNPPTQNRFQLVQVELVFVGEESGEEV